MKSTLTQNPDLQTIGPICCIPAMRMTRILGFQFFASMILTLSTMVSYGPEGQTSYTQCAFISLGMFYAFVVGGQITGGQGNPIITISLIFTRGSNVTILNSLVYFVSQFAGAIVGGAFGYWTIDHKYGAPIPIPTNNYPLAFGRQILGTFSFIILYLIIMSASTKIQTNFWNYILVPVAFYMSKMISDQYNSLNPAAVLGNQVFYGIISYGSWVPMNSYWVYIIGPLIGAVVGSLIFNFFLLPYHRIMVAKKN